MNAKKQAIYRRASEIAGSIWEDRDPKGALKDQLLSAAAWRNMGTDADLTDTDRAALRQLAAEAASLES